MAINDVMSPPEIIWRRRTWKTRLQDAWNIARGRTTLENVQRSYQPQTDCSTAIVIRGYGRMSPEQRAEIDRWLASR